MVNNGLYHTIKIFTTLRKRAFGNIVGKGEHAANQHFFTLFSALSITNFNFQIIFNLLSANTMNFNLSKLLSSGKELNVIG